MPSMNVIPTFCITGGGGAKCAGSDGAGPSPAPQMGPGGAGQPSEISGSAVTRAGGGAGGGSCTSSTSGGTGGKGVVIIRYKFQ